MQNNESILRRAFDVKKAGNYFLLVLIIATTANPFFFDSNEFLIAGFCLSAFVFLKRGKRFDRNFFKVSGLFLLLEIIQIVSFGEFSFQTFSSMFIKLTFAYFVVKCLEGNFFSYYIQIMKVICLISLGFYTLSFVPGFYDFVYNSITPFFNPPFYKTSEFFTAQKNVILYTFAYDCFLTYRNPGPFWEPGIYAIFIIFALIMSLSKEQHLRSKTNLIFIVTLLTTLSTAGYLGLFLLIFFYFLSSNNTRNKEVYIVLTVIIALYLYYSLSFLSNKLLQNMQMSDFTGSRFGSLVADWSLFVKSPLIGWGRGSMRYGGSYHTFFSQELHRNNGLASLLTQYGLPLTIVYFWLYRTTLKYMCKLHGYTIWFASAALVVIMFVSFSQVIYTRQFFLCFLFLGLHFRKLNSQVV